jgi:hypothetical protein
MHSTGLSAVRSGGFNSIYTQVQTTFSIFLDPDSLSGYIIDLVLHVARFQDRNGLTLGRSADLLIELLRR